MNNKTPIKTIIFENLKKCEKVKVIYEGNIKNLSR